MYGCSMINPWARLTDFTSRACASMDMKRCRMPMPPARAIAIAMADSVTVSMFALMMGMLSVMRRVSRDWVLTAERLTMPVYLSHGAKDVLIPVAGVRALAARLRELGRRVQCVELPEGGHDSPVLEINWPAALDFVAQR